MHSAPSQCLFVTVIVRVCVCVCACCRHFKSAQRFSIIACSPCCCLLHLLPLLTVACVLHTVSVRVAGCWLSVAFLLRPGSPPWDTRSPPPAPLPRPPAAGSRRHAYTLLHECTATEAMRDSFLPAYPPEGVPFPDQSDHRGKNEVYHWENLVGPFLVHKILGPRPPLPSSNKSLDCPQQLVPGMWCGVQGTRSYPLGGA